MNRSDKSRRPRRPAKAAKAANKKPGKSSPEKSPKVKPGRPVAPTPPPTNGDGHPPPPKPVIQVTAPAEGQPSAHMDAGGLLRPVNAERLAALPVHFWPETGKWYVPAAGIGDRFVQMKEGSVAAYLAEHGFSRRFKDDAGNSPCDRAMLWLQQQHCVSYAGPLAGHRAGLNYVCGVRILVTDSPRLVTPAAGELPVISRLLQGLFADPVHDQLNVFLTWAASSFQDFWHRVATPGPWPFRHCPALGIFGPRGCGKTALVDLVLTPLFGGRKGDPMTYLREKRFNKDIIRTELLALDDKGAGSGLTERRERGEAIKDMIWKPDQRMEGKGADAVTVQPYWRLVIAGNDDDAGLQVCPTLSPGLHDKLILLRAARPDDLPASKDDNDRWAASLANELPALAALLLAYRTPENLAGADRMELDPRTRVLNFRHPEIEGRLLEAQPEMKLLEIIATLARQDAELFTPFWSGSSTEFERLVRSKDAGVADRLFTSAAAVGRMLSELARIRPEVVTRRDRQGLSHYRIFGLRSAPVPE